MLERPRRNRRTEAIRGFVRETHLSASHLVLPAFVHEAEKPHPIASMSGHSRLGISDLVKLARDATKLRGYGPALFPAIDTDKKDAYGKESENETGLLQRAVRSLKSEVPEMVLFTDVALDPYSSDGHDGVVVDGKIDNDITLPILARMAVSQAAA